MCNRDSKWLLHKREAIRKMLRVRFDEKRDTTPLLDEYYETIKELKDRGIKTATRSGTVYLRYNKAGTKESHQKIIKPSNDRKKFYINIAWNSKTNNIKIIQNYLKTLKIKQVNAEFSEFPDRKEYINTYIYQGTKSELNIIKSTVNYLIETQRDNNIAIY